MLVNHIHQAGPSIYGGNLQSFNLRRTVKSTPSDIPRPTTDATSGNVAAILKKASAIRQVRAFRIFFQKYSFPNLCFSFVWCLLIVCLFYQAFVSSDEGGDDDSWSDAWYPKPWRNSCEWLLVLSIPQARECF